MTAMMVAAVALSSLATTSTAFVVSSLQRQRKVGCLGLKERRIYRVPRVYTTTVASHQDGKNEPFCHSAPRHVAFICDGNQRWAKRKRLHTSLGHKKGADRLVELIEYFAAVADAENDNDHYIEHVTLYGFSTENWKRTPREIKEIFQVMEMTARSLLRQPQSKRKRPIQVRIVGDLDDERIPNGARQALRELEEATGKSVKSYCSNSVTSHLPKLTVSLAINYGGRQDIVQACQKIAEQVAEGMISPQDVSQELLAEHLYTANLPDPDMIIRTSGECRLSNFLLWDCAYSELYMTDTLWPDFDIACWNKAVEWYSQRQRRFGARNNSTNGGDDLKNVAAADVAFQQVPNLREVSSNSTQNVIHSGVASP
jgi:undecaprenyl diphosphate synthase